MAARLFQQSQIFDNESNVLTASEALDGKVVGIYFSAHWCPPCRSFTPRLAEKYKEIIKAGHPFEIVFVSSDRSEDECMKYFQEMPWKLLDYKARDIKDNLSQPLIGFGVQGIPTLVLLDENGELITKDGRSAIMTTPFEKFKTFESDKLEAEKNANEIINGLPQTVQHECHKHPLVKTSDRRYGCDICHGDGSKWSFTCTECNFDAHPKCIFPSSFK